MQLRKKKLTVTMDSAAPAGRPRSGSGTLKNRYENILSHRASKEALMRGIFAKFLSGKPVSIIIPKWTRELLF
jgi:hypothetical protein